MKLLAYHYIILQWEIKSKFMNPVWIILIKLIWNLGSDPRQNINWENLFRALIVFGENYLYFYIWPRDKISIDILKFTNICILRKFFDFKKMWSMLKSHVHDINNCLAWKRMALYDSNQFCNIIPLLDRHIIICVS